MKTLLKNWYKAGPTALKWCSKLKGLHLEARKGLLDGEAYLFLYDDSILVWECNEVFFFGHFYQVKDSGKSLNLTG